MYLNFNRDRGPDVSSVATPIQDQISAGRLPDSFDNHSKPADWVDSVVASPHRINILSNSVRENGLSPNVTFAEFVQEGKYSQSEVSPGAIDRCLHYLGAAMRSARKRNVLPNILLGIMYRETRCRNVIGDNGHGRGVMQIDDRSHGEWLKQHESGLTPESNIDFGATILEQNLKSFDNDYRAALAAYNAGPGMVRRAMRAGEDPEVVTTHGDYPSEVMRAAEIFSQYTEGYTNREVPR